MPHSAEIIAEAPEIGLGMKTKRHAKRCPGFDGIAGVCV
jgi:hypothetical protein